MFSPRSALALVLAAAAPAAAQVEWSHHRPTTTGVLGDYVQAIGLDENDRPWIAAYTPFWEEGGMSRMNADGTWTVLSSFDHPQIGSPRFNDIARDAAGTMWIGTYDGLLRYDPAAGPASAHLYTPANSGIVGGRVYDVDLAPDNTLWMAIYDVTGPGGGLARLDLTTGGWQTWTTANGLPWGPQWPNWDNLGHVAVLPDAEGPGYTVWFSSATNLGCGTYRNGVFQSQGNPQSPPPGLYPIELMSADAVDELGNLWVLTSQGMARRSRDGQYTIVGYPAGLDTEVARVQALRNGRAVLGTYYADVFIWDDSLGGWNSIGNWGSGNHTYAFAEDSDGGLWAGGIGGAAYYQNGSWQRHRLTNSGMIGFFTEAIDFAPDGRVFINGNAGPGVGGFDIFDGMGWTCVNNHNYGLGPAWGLPTDNVSGICVRSGGTVALALSGPQGLVEWDGFSFTYLIPQGFGVHEVVEDGLGRLWAVHDYSGGVSRITGAQRDVFSSVNSPMPAGDLNSVVVDPNDTSFVWITTAFGVARTDGQTWTVYPRTLLGLTQNTLSQLLSRAAPHPDGSVWIGSYNGLYHFNPSSGQYTRYHPGNSALPSPDVHHVHIAPDGSVWAATFDDVYPYPGGLTHFDGETWTTYQQATSPLPHNQINVLTSREVPGGYELWVGTASEAVAVLTVATGAACPADWNGDAAVNSGDISAFLTSWIASVTAGDLVADFSGDGAVNSSDISAFLTAWLDAVQNGC